MSCARFGSSPFRPEHADVGPVRKEAYVPPRGLPGNANLEQLKNGAKSFQRAVRAGDVGAVEVVREFHPRLGDAAAGSPELAAFSHADALLVVARRFGFASWPTLKAHLELVAPLARSPHEVGPSDSAADEFLRLACLTYGDDEPARWAEAERMLAAAPELATANLATIAAVDAARELLLRDAGGVRVPLGPHRWQPLLYLTYSRVAAPAAFETAELLLDLGADPNAGYLWEGLCPPLTALTGAFGSGEGTNPAHPDGVRIARLLLERGADPNDGQTIYNMGASPGDEWLELLLEFGLGRGDRGPWRRLLGERQDSPRQMLEDALMAAAAHGRAHRVRLLLDHGADPDGAGSRHPIYEGRSPIEEAAVSGNPEIVAMLEVAGARLALDDVQALLAAATAGDREAVQAMRAGDPTLVERGLAREPGQLIRAAGRDSVEGVRLLIELGFDVNARERTAALHEAAMRGNLAIIELLLDHGANPNLRDTGYDATPAGWAEHHGHTKAQLLLAAHETRTEETVTTELAYRPGEPVRVTVAHRAQRTSVSDEGAAVQRAGKPAGWLAIAGQLERDRDVNITRQGVVWLPVVAAGPGEKAVVERIAEVSLALYQDLLELGR
jgi:ankyrin repeat protein